MTTREIQIAEIRDLSTPEKILFLEDLWDSIAAQDAEVPVPESHKAELERRFERHRHTPGELLSLEELQERIENRQ